jgi:hypothetical protein
MSSTDRRESENINSADPLADPQEERARVPCLDDISPDVYGPNAVVIIKGHVCQFLYREEHGPHVFFDTATRKPLPLHTSEILALMESKEYIRPGGDTPSSEAPTELDEVGRQYLRLKPLQRMKQPEATARVIEVLSFHEVDMLIVDEAQQAFRGRGENAPHALGEWLLPMENAKAFKIVLVGSPELKKLFEKVLAARARHGGLAYLKPFDFKTEVDKRLSGAFVEQFHSHLPFDSTCLCDDKHKVIERRLFDVYFATRGVQGEFPKLCESAAISGFERCGRVPNRLTLADFAAGFEYLYHDDKRMKGVNPFATEDLRNIPTIPLSLKDAEDAEDAERESVEQPRTRTRRSRTRGSRIRD